VGYANDQIDQARTGLTDPPEFPSSTLQPQELSNRRTGNDDEH
jgi:hypothetical protein